MQEVRQGSLGQDFQQDQEVRDATQSVSEATLKAEKLRLHIAEGNSPSLCPPAPKKGWGKLVFDYADQMWVEDIGGKAGVRYGPPVKGLVQGKEMYFDKGPARYKPSHTSTRSMKRTNRGQFGKKGAIRSIVQRLQQQMAAGNTTIRLGKVSTVKAAVKKDTAS